MLRFETKRWNRYHSIVFVSPSWRMLRYKACVNLPSILHIQPMPWKVIQPPQKIARPPCLTIWLTWWACEWDSPSFTQHRVRPSNLNKLILVSSLKITIYQSCIVQSWWHWTISTCKANSWLWATATFASLMNQDLLHEVHTSLCWCSNHISSAHSKHSSRLQRYLIHQFWWFLRTLVIEQGGTSRCPILEGSTWGTHTLQIL